MVFDIIASHRQIGFSGSRHSLAKPFGTKIDPEAGDLAAGAVPVGAEVVVGCAAGADAFFRSRFPAARVLRVDPVLGRAGFARRSIACVEAVSSGLWVSFPGGVCQAWLIALRVVWAVF